jgi:hypothetical protein
MVTWMRKEGIDRGNSEQGHKKNLAREGGRDPLEKLSGRESD